MKKLYVPSPEQKESARHGETLFPMQKYITKLDLVYPVVTTHWHEEAELTLITEGEGLYQIDLVDYEVKKGDILFVPPMCRFEKFFVRLHRFIMKRCQDMSLH